jgi:hypothetical protein
MRVNRELIRIILDQLDGIYPVRIGHQDYIVEDRQNRKEIINHLFYLQDKGLIEFRDWSSRTEKACGEIRIAVPEGRNYLNSLS